MLVVWRDKNGIGFIAGCGFNTSFLFLNKCRLGYGEKVDEFEGIPRIKS
jgi:hypothetical protein